MKPGVILGFFCVQRQPREVNHVILFQYPNSGGASTQHPEIQAPISTGEAPGIFRSKVCPIRKIPGASPGHLCKRIIFQKTRTFPDLLLNLGRLRVCPIRSQSTILPKNTTKIFFSLDRKFYICSNKINKYDKESDHTSF